MAVILSEDWEANNWDNWSVHNSNWSIQSDIKHGGTYAAKAAYGASNRVLYKTQAAGSCVWDMWVYFDATGSRAFPVYPKASNGRRIYALSNYDTGHWQYYTGAWHNLPVDTTWTSGQWYHLVVTIVFESSELKWTIDGVDKGSVVLKDDQGTQLTAAHSLTELALQNASASVNMYVDDIAISDYVPPAPCTAESSGVWFV